MVSGVRLRLSDSAFQNRPKGLWAYIVFEEISGYGVTRIALKPDTCFLLTPDTCMVEQDD
jgi:hypothetical protein